jgi:hypothetical protein
MATYQIEVEPIATTQITGRLGAALVSYRGHDYRVTLGGKEITRDGYPCGADVLPARVYAYAVEMYDMLAKTYLERKAA